MAVSAMRAAGAPRIRNRWDAWERGGGSIRRRLKHKKDRDIRRRDTVVCALAAGADHVHEELLLRQHVRRVVHQVQLRVRLPVERVHLHAVHRLVLVSVAQERGLRLDEGRPVANELGSAVSAHATYSE